MSDDNNQSQVDGTTGTTEGASTTTPADDSGLSIDELRAELAKVRREAAGRRVANRELEDKAKKYDEWQREQLTEVERLKADLETAKAELGKTARSRRAREIAKEAGLEADDADLIVGTSDEEMRQSAERLAARIGKPGAAQLPANGLFGGPRGSSVAAHRSQDAAAAFRSLFDKPTN